MALTVKFSLDGDFRRACVAEPSAEAFRSVAQQHYGQKLPAAFDLKYLDDDNDLCTLTPETVSDFLELNAGNSVAKVLVFPLAPVTASTSTVGTISPAAAAVCAAPAATAEADVDCECQQPRHEQQLPLQQPPQQLPLQQQHHCEYREHHCEYREHDGRHRHCGCHGHL